MARLVILYLADGFLGYLPIAMPDRREMMDMRSQETLLAEIGDNANMLDDQAFAMLVMEWQSESEERRKLLLQILAAVGIETIRPIANKLAGLAS